MWAFVRGGESKAEATLFGFLVFLGGFSEDATAH